MKIVIPAYEPDSKLIQLVKGIKEKTQIDIVIINDGSEKQYESIFQEVKALQVTVLKHDTNQGKGQAIKTGIQYLMTIGETEGCVFADSDGQHTPEDILKIIHETKKSNCLVLGVRRFDGKIPFRSKIGNIMTRGLFRIMTGMKITDTQTGLRGYPSSMFEWLLSIPGERYEYEFNVLLELKEAGFTYQEVEIKTIYEEKNPTSHFRPIQDSLRIYKPVVKFILSSIASTVIDFILFFTLQYMFQTLWISVVGARIISSIFNFLCNKNYVFAKKEFKISMLFKYYTLVVGIMGLNYLILNTLYILTRQLVISKIITETMLYIFSFSVQKRLIF